MAQIASSLSPSTRGTPSTISMPRTIGTAPIVICQPTRAPLEMVQSVFLITTVPSAQEIAAPNMKSVPSGAAPRTAMSSPMSTARPAVPRPSPAHFPAVMRSPRKKAPNRLVQIGMVKAMMAARPAGIRLMP